MNEILREKIVGLLPRARKAIRDHFGESDEIMNSAIHALDRWCETFEKGAINRSYDDVNYRAIPQDLEEKYETDMAIFLMLRSIRHESTEYTEAAIEHFNEVDALCEPTNMLREIAACDSIDAFVRLRDKARKMLDSQDASCPK